MDLNKAVAKHALSFIGGTPQVFRYNSSDELKTIDIMTCKNSPYNDIDVFATIGLANHDIGLSYEKKQLRVELMAIGPIGDVDWANIIASAAFEVMDYKTCSYGTIIPNVVGEYKKSIQLPHLLLLSPNYWASYAPLQLDDFVIAWLFAVPISNSECEYIVENGTEAFEKMLNENHIDLSNLNRPLVL